MFSGWSGDLVGNSNPDSITITRDKSVIATFTEFSPNSPYDYPEDTYHLIYGDVSLEPTWENLQYAMDNAGSEIIFLPEGTIWVEGRMYPKENNRIVGRGQSKSILESNREIPVNDVEYMIPLWIESTENNVELGCFSIKMHQKGSNAINVYSDHCYIHHVDIYEAGFNGLYTPGASYLLAHDINCYNGISDPEAGCHGFAFGAIDNSTTYNLSVYGWSSGFDYYAQYVNAWNLYGENLTSLTMKVIQGSGVNPHHSTFRNIELHAKDGYDPDGFKIYANSFCTFENIKCDRFYIHPGYTDHDNIFRNITITGDYGSCQGFSILGSNHYLENIYVEGSRIYGFEVNGNNIIARNIHVNGHLSYNRITGTNIQLYDSIFEGGVNTQEMVISPSSGITNGLILNNCIFRNCNSNGIDIAYAINFQITNCSVLTCANAIGILNVNCNNFVIRYNYFCWNTYNGIIDNTPATANKVISENEVC
jgi:hypothetical protein